jgi:SWI/SNF-related matrix-associated actin-dependent regulator 1 of chromatin subfamily A
MLQIEQINTGYKVKFAYNPSVVAGIKKIPGAKFRKTADEKYWLIPDTSAAAFLNWANYFNPQFSAEGPKEDFDEDQPLPELSLQIDLKRQMFPYQSKGVAYSLEKKRLIVGDQPGLGKTGQAIATMMGAKAKCILVICPATLRENWKREWKIWTDKEVMILTDKIKKTWPTYYNVGMINVFICNYESLKKFFVASINKPEGKPLRLNHIIFNDTINLFDAVIIDESHRCKDGKTQQSKFCMGISKGKEWVLCLTGTPVVNKPIDLIPQLHIIDRLSDFGGYKFFVDRYCGGWSQASNLKELNFRMKKYCFYRREKTEVLKDLPDKMRSIMRVDITTKQEYEKAENEFIDYLRENLNKTEGEITTALRGETMVLMGILKQIAARGKVNDVIDHIQEVVDAGEKIVVFAWHKEIVYELKKALPGSVTLVGDDNMASRQKSVDSFQNDPKVQIILCNIKSGGVGITLTASSRVCFIELPWHSADAEQCEDRCHRIGQKDSVQCTYFLGHDTIDEYIYNIIEKKRKMANEVTGAEDKVETNVVDEFINLFSKKYSKQDQ